MTIFPTSTIVDDGIFPRGFLVIQAHRRQSAQAAISQPAGSALEVSNGDGSATSRWAGVPEPGSTAGKYDPLISWPQKGPMRQRSATSVPHWGWGGRLFQVHSRSLVLSKGGSKQSVAGKSVVDMYTKICLIHLLLPSRSPTCRNKTYSTFLVFQMTTFYWFYFTCVNFNVRKKFKTLVASWYSSNL